MSRAALASALLAWLVLGCADPTEVVVVVDTDLPVPPDLNIVVVATGPDGTPHESIAPIHAPEDLPAYVGLIHEDGALGPFLVRAEARRTGDRLVVRRDAVFTFEDGAVLMLTMHLLAACRGVRCAAFETCGDDGMCRSVLVSPSELREWRGSPPGID